MTETSTYSPTAPSLTQTRNTLLSVFGIGAITGLLGWLLTLALQHFFIDALFCRSADNFAFCANTTMTSWVIASIIVGFGSIFVLVRANVYRPLLAIIGIYAALWGLSFWLEPLSWYMASFWQAIIFGLTYALFVHLASIERFIFSLLATIAAAIAIGFFVGL